MTQQTKETKDTSRRRVSNPLDALAGAGYSGHLFHDTYNSVSIKVSQLTLSPEEAIGGGRIL